MNFTSDIKREIITRGIEGRAAEKAALSAFVRTSGQTAVCDGKPDFFIVTETENVAEFFTALFGRAFGKDGRELSVAAASKDRKSGRDKLVLTCADGAEEVLTALGLWKRTAGRSKDAGERDYGWGDSDAIGSATIAIPSGLRPSFRRGFASPLNDSRDGACLNDKRNAEKAAGRFVAGIAAKLTADEESARAYVKGAFLGGGSCILPSEGGKTGYHLEFVFPSAKVAADFCALLGEQELLAKRVKRAGGYVVYMKSKEAISDFLSVVGAENALKKFASFMEKRDESNNSNRAANCFSGNADKAATAAVRQVMAIEKIENAGGMSALSEELRATAQARKDNPTASLQELADALKIGKSCLNHRLRKLSELAARLP